MYGGLCIVCVKTDLLGTEIDGRFFPLYYCSIYILRQVLLLNLKLAVLAWLAGNQGPGILPFPFPQCSDDRYLTPRLTFYISTGGLDSGHLASAADPLPTEPPPRF